MEEKVNKDNIKEVDSSEPIDDYTLTKEQINNNQGNLYSNFNSNNFNSKISTNPNDFVPINAVDTAFHLISNSNTTNFLPEIDKEVKLTNLNFMESYNVLQYMSLIEELDWISKQQEMKQLENEYVNQDNNTNTKEIYLEQLEKQLDTNRGKPDYYDVLGALRKVFNISVVGRAKMGFERSKQVETISKSEQILEDKTNQRPGFMAKFGGGFKR